MKNLKKITSAHSLLSHGEYKSFRVYGNIGDWLIDPVKIILLAGLVMVNVVSLNISQNFLQPKSLGQAKVLGEATSSKAIADETIYKLSLKSLVSGYLNGRSKYLVSQSPLALSEAQIISWKNLIESVRKQIMKLKVPGRYKGLHLDVVATLSKEWQLINKPNNKNIDLPQISKLWQNILNEYPWLNE